MRRTLDYARRYVGEARRAPAGVAGVGPARLVRDFRAWLETQGQDGLEAGRPWITLEAERVLRAIVQPGTRAFEYGSGGSTAFLARRGAELVSVEHDPAWFEQVARAVTSPALEMVLALPRPSADASEAAYGSSSPAFAGQTFLDYVAVVDRYPDHHFDLLIVDGRARTSAFFRAQPKVRIGGAILLDDSERPSYRPAVEAARAAGWREIGRYGPKLFTPYFARTTIWTKTSDLPARG